MTKRTAILITAGIALAIYALATESAAPSCSPQRGSAQQACESDGGYADRVRHEASQAEIVGRICRREHADPMDALHCMDARLSPEGA